jgi:hypothetical protein
MLLQQRLECLAEASLVHLAARGAVDVRGEPGARCLVIVDGTYTDASASSVLATKGGVRIGNDAPTLVRAFGQASRIREATAAGQP